MARRVEAKVCLGRVRGRQRLGWMDGMKVALGNKLMTVEAAPPPERSERVKSSGTYVTE